MLSHPCCWLHLVIPGTLDRISTHVAVRVYLLLIEMTGTKPGISYEVQDVDIFPRFVLPLYVESVPSIFSTKRDLYPHHISHDGIDV